MWVIVYVLELDTCCIRSQQISAMVSRYGLLLSKSFWKSFCIRANGDDYTSSKGIENVIYTLNGKSNRKINNLCH